jgi:hypothetical protein
MGEIIKMYRWHEAGLARGIGPFLMPHLIHVEYKVRWNTRDFLPKKRKMFSNGLDRYTHSGPIHGHPSTTLNIRVPGQYMNQTIGCHIDTHILVDVALDLRHRPRARLVASGNDTRFEVKNLRRIQNGRPSPSEIAIGIN